MTRLNRTTAPQGHLIGASAPERTGIVHLGIGNFHRAHAAVYTAKAMAAQPGDWGIVGVANRSRKVIDAMAEQDHLYSVLELSPEGERADLVDVHRRTVVAAEQPAELRAALADEQHKIITMTISENGYLRNSVTGKLDLDSESVKADLANFSEPRTMIGQVASSMVRRFEGHQAPVTVLSCDNMQSAGHTSEALVRQFLQASGQGGAFFDWFEKSVSFPNAMVDRIVPAPNGHTRARVAELLGMEDLAAVPAERFTMWVLEDRFAAGRPAWEQAGAIFSDEVEAYELVKLRLLNGSHSLIAYLGGLDGDETIPSSRGQEFVAQCVDAAIRNEYLPSIGLPQGFDADAYIAELFDRWNNHALGDRTSRVGTDGSAKLQQRVPEPALRMLKRGEVPAQLALTVAAWICCVCPPVGFQPGPIADEMGDPARERLAQVTAGAASPRAHAEAVMTGGFFPEELAAQTEFTNLVAGFVEVIVREGVRAAAAEALAMAPTH